MARLGPTGLTQVCVEIKNWVVSKLSSKANDSDVVHKSEDETIDGNKTFGSLFTKASGPSIWMKNNSFVMGTAPATNRYTGLWIKDTNDNDVAYIVHQANKNNSQNIRLLVSNTDGVNIYQTALTFQSTINGEFNFYPDADNVVNLGKSTNKWVNVYATNVTGYLVGNATSATKATQDGDGNVITDTYATKLYVDNEISGVDVILQPSITGSIILNGTTDNTVVMTDIVTKLSLEIGDVIRIVTGAYNKLHTVESITDNDSIIVNYEHAGNRADGSLKLPDFTGQATVTRIAKWFNAPIGMGQAWQDVLRSRAANTTYTNTTGRPIMVVLSMNSSNAVYGHIL